MGFTLRVIGLFFFHEFDVGLLVGWQSLKVIVTSSSTGRRVYFVSRQGGWQSDAVVSSLWIQHRLSILYVIIQQGFQVSFVMIRIRLRTDERAIESDTYLLKQGVSQVIDGKQIIACSHIISIAFLDSQFQFEVTAREIHVIFLWVHLEFHGIYACREGLNGYHSITRDAEIGGTLNKSNMGLVVQSERREGVNRSSSSFLASCLQSFLQPTVVKSFCA